MQKYLRVDPFVVLIRFFLFKRSTDNAQQKSHASGAKFNVFRRDILVLADGLALKAVLFGSLMLALLA
jgi:hypothetical protein